MSKSNTFENELLLLVFNNDTLSLVGDATGIVGSGVDGSLYVSLHTGDPGEAGSQTTNETSYTNYVRVAVPRTVGGWTVTGNSVVNAALVQFAACGVTGATLTHFGVGASSAGAGKLLYSGSLTSPLIVSSGIQPQYAAGDLEVTED